MKKQYITPCASIVKIAPTSVIAASQAPSSLQYGNSNEFEGPTVAESSRFAGGLTEDNSSNESSVEF